MRGVFPEVVAKEAQRVSKQTSSPSVSQAMKKLAKNPPSV